MVENSTWHIGIWPVRINDPTTHGLAPPLACEHEAEHATQREAVMQPVTQVDEAAMITHAYIVAVAHECSLSKAHEQNRPTMPMIDACTV